LMIIISLIELGSNTVPYKILRKVI